MSGASCHKLKLCLCRLRNAIDVIVGDEEMLNFIADDQKALGEITHLSDNAECRLVGLSVESFNNG